MEILPVRDSENEFINVSVALVIGRRVSFNSRGGEFGVRQPSEGRDDPVEREDGECRRPSDFGRKAVRTKMPAPISAAISSIVGFRSPIFGSGARSPQWLTSNMMCANQS